MHLGQLVGLFAARLPPRQLEEGCKLHKKKMNFFWPTRPEKQWMSVGPLSSFPDIASEDERNIIQTRLCDSTPRPGCKIFHVPKEMPTQGTEIEVPLDIIESPSHGDELTDQVLVFQYNGKMHAVDHVRKTDS